MSGATIESIIDYIYKAVPIWFTIVQKLAKMSSGYT